MITRTILLSSAMGFLLLAVPANASHAQKWYIGVEAGANWISDVAVDVDTIDPFFGGGFPPAGSEFDTGFAMLGTVGYTWTNVRVELELGYRANDFDSFASAGGFTGTGELSEFTQMVNFVYDWHLGPKCTLSLGAGMGGDSIQYKNSLHTVAFDDGDYVFAWQLMAGLSHPISPGLDLVLNYRYFNAASAEFTEVAGAILHNDTYDDLEKHTLTLGLRFDLGPD